MSVPDSAVSARANRGYWDSAADDYQAEHGEFLRDDGFVWCPEGLDEAEAGLLGDVRGLAILEVGCGAGQCGRYLAAQGASVAAFDVSHRQLQHSRRIDLSAGTTLPVVQADAEKIPFLTGTFDLACSAFGAMPFVADATGALREVARVLKPGGRFVFAVSHPMRWAFPDDPGPGGLTSDRSYFDRTPYVERNEAGEVTYVEHHRTMGDWITAITGAGLRLDELIEPEWPATHDRVWGGWSPLRGRHFPGTAIFRVVSP
ncbi:class I SAM-dependent methyltransferase [Herbidospora yilanensis]|uniref:class I SAM-dependent methyltransferase n=1 Tax=Herbidospora yilanensis TaxID=354426 RepID=UPI0007848D22|nr:class I SAM-dependent methyltransferase [Herbidospora yilanensis]